MTAVVLKWTSSLDAYWVFRSKEEFLGFLQDRNEDDHEIAWDAPIDEVLDELADALGMNVFELAEDLCRDQDDISGPVSHGLTVEGPTRGDVDDIQSRKVGHTRHERADGGIAIYWIDRDAFEYSAEIEVEDSLDYGKLSFVLTPVYDDHPVIVEVLYDGESIALEQEEQGGYQPRSGFDL